MIRRILAKAVRAAFEQYPVVTLTGPRQSGKTTLARGAFDLPYVNLEAPDHREFATEDPRGFLAKYADGAIIDEIHRAPDLTSWLQVQVDETGRPGQYLLTGSHNFSVRQMLSQSLAGRTALLTLLPFSWEELDAAGAIPGWGMSKSDIAGSSSGIGSDPGSSFERILVGGYPRIYDAGLDPTNFCRDYVGTYVERDVRQLTAIRNLSRLQTFMRLCAANVGQLLNLNQLSRDCGISQATASEWFDLMEASYVLYRLNPWFANTRKRLVKRPKLYFHDTGVACFLLGLTSPAHVESHPLRGALFENAVVNEIRKFDLNRNRATELSFYRDSNGNEVDLLYRRGSRLVPIEIKSGQTASKDDFRQINRFRAQSAAEPGAVAYAGTEPRSHANGQSTVPCHDLPAFLDSLT